MLSPVIFKGLLHLNILNVADGCLCCLAQLTELRHCTHYTSSPSLVTAIRDNLEHGNQASSRSWANYSPTGICLGLWLFSKVQHKSEIVVWNFKSLEKFKFAISRFINLLQSSSFRLFPFLNGSIRRTKEK